MIAFLLITIHVLTHTHAHTHAHTHIITHMPARMHARMHAYSLSHIVCMKSDSHSHKHELYIIMP